MARRSSIASSAKPTRRTTLSAAAAILPACVVAALAFGPTSCNGDGALSDDDGRYALRIVATTGMVADIARNLGGDHVLVEALMGEGTDPHGYRASPGDVKKLTSSRTDLVLYNGLHLEGKMVEMLAGLAAKKSVHAVTDAIPRDKLRAPPEFADQYDPHVWFDVSMWIHCVEHVRDLLVDLDSSHAEDYRRNATAYIDRLRALHTEVAAAMATIPEAQRVLVTAHDAFGYFGRAYDLEVLGVQGISTESEAGVRRVRELVDEIVSRKVKAVFVESSVSEQNIRALVEGCASRGHEVSIGGQLYSDAMGAPGTPEGTYEGMVRHNVTTIAEALR